MTMSLTISLASGDGMHFRLCIVFAISRRLREQPAYAQADTWHELQFVFHLRGTPRKG